jgi:hypothetical protein
MAGPARHRVALLWIAAFLVPAAQAASQVVQAGNMTVQIAPWQPWVSDPQREGIYEAARNAARLTAEEVGPSRVRIQLAFDAAPEGFDQLLVLQVDFVPRWPGYEYDIQVVDAEGTPVPARRQSGLERQLMIAVPARNRTYYVQATRPGQEDPTPPPEGARTAQEPETGLAATICRWYDGRRAAVSLRFDDSYPSHILTAIPILREYGYCGTFFINPGSGEFLARRGAWESCAAAGDQEFANHTMHHRGARDDAEVDHELGEAATYIRSLFRGKSELLCVNLGGGTVWTHAMPLRHFFHKHRLVDPRPRLAISMTNDRANAYKDLLDQAIQTGAWAVALFHQIGSPWVSEATFRSVLETTREREQQLWIAGMAAVHKYERERDHSALSMRTGAPDEVRLALTCRTDPALYDQPLTIELTLPDEWAPQAVRVRSAEGAAVEVREVGGARPAVVRFDLPPSDGEYLISR